MADSATWNETRSALVERCAVFVRFKVRLVLKCICKYSVYVLSVGREKRRVAWGENSSDDQSKEKTNGVKKFSENRSKSSREQRGQGPIRDTQKHRSSTSGDWRSDRNVTEDRKEPRKNNVFNERSKFTSTVDACIGRDDS